MVKTFRQFLEEKRLAENATVTTQTVTGSLSPMLGLPAMGSSPGILAKTMLKTPGLASFPVLMAQEPAVQDAVAKLNAKVNKGKAPTNIQNVNNAVPVTGALPGS